MRVVESGGGFATATKEIVATEPNNPVAIFEIEASVGDTLIAEKSYLFSAAKSTSPNGKITKYVWDMGDGTKKETRTVTYTYAKPGTYEVTLQVSDETGETAESTKRIKVINEGTAPTAVLKTEPGLSDDKYVKGTIPLTIKFDATTSTDKDNDIVEYAWDFESDGQMDTSDTKAEHTYTAEGEYKVTLKITDAAGHNTTLEQKIAAKIPGTQAVL